MLGLCRVPPVRDPPRLPPSQCALPAASCAAAAAAAHAAPPDVAEGEKIISFGWGSGMVYLQIVSPRKSFLTLRADKVSFARVVNGPPMSVQKVSLLENLSTLLTGVIHACSEN